MTPEDFENACKQPVIIGTVISMFVMLPVNMLGMYAWFIKMDQMFNPDRLLANKRRERFVKHITNKQYRHRYIK